jgi:hypothetical protein
MDSEKVNEFKTYIRRFIDSNGEKVFSKRIHWENIPEKITINATKGLNIPKDESIMMMIDSSLTGSGKDGMALTDWGVRYNDGVDSWSLTWNDLSEKYDFVKTKGSFGIDEPLLQVKPGDDFTPNKKISMSMADIKCDILARILNKSCQIFTGKNIALSDTTIEKIQTSDEKIPTPESESQSQPEPKQETNKAPEVLTPAQEAERKRWRKEDAREEARDRDFIEKIRNHGIGGSGSFLSKNIGGVILCSILSIFFAIGGSTILGFILALPLSFLGYIIGNKLRLALHPDFVIADGFMGLLKEKIFWRFGPQVIGALIGLVIGIGLGMTIGF